MSWESVDAKLLSVGTGIDGAAEGFGPLCSGCCSTGYIAVRRQKLVTV